jgi:hypothetical protein
VKLINDIKHVKAIIDKAGIARLGYEILIYIYIYVGNTKEIN